MYSFVNLVQIYYRRENKRRDRLFGQPMKNAVVVVVVPELAAGEANVEEVKPAVEDLEEDLRGEGVHCGHCGCWYLVLGGVV